LQLNPQALALQVAVALAGGAHGAHDVPQLLVLLSAWQVPAQSWLPLRQAPWQLWAVAIQAPAHSFMVLGQVPPQILPSHVAVPPVGTGQGEQEEPQVATSALLAHVVPQVW